MNIKLRLACGRRRWKANARMFFHMSPAAREECVACDEPESTEGMAV